MSDRKKPVAHRGSHKKMKLPRSHSALARNEGLKKKGVLRAAPEIYSVVDERCTLVVNEERREVFRLTGLEQVVWDCLELGYNLQQARRTLSALGDLSQEATGRALDSMLQEWQTLGLVEIEAGLHG